jgi:DNA-binding winged helix-turn-helix (wHTH) protein
MDERPRLPAPQDLRTTRERQFDESRQAQARRHARIVMFQMNGSSNPHINPEDLAILYLGDLESKESAAEVSRRAQEAFRHSRLAQMRPLACSEPDNFQFARIYLQDLAAEGIFSTEEVASVKLVPRPKPVIKDTESGDDLSGDPNKEEDAAEPQDLVLPNFNINGVEFDGEGLTVKTPRLEEPARLTRAYALILSLLASNAGKGVSREKIASTLRKNRLTATDANLRNIVSVIKRTLNPDNRTEYIGTLRNTDFIFYTSPDQRESDD